jgi:hypothetical protein
MSCPLCGNIAAREDLSFGGGRRFFCEPCGGFFRISSSLDAIAEGNTYDACRARERLEEKREAKKREPLDPNRPQDLEPALSSEDKDLLIEPD